VIIKGKVDSSYFAQASTIYAYTYEDYISYKEKELARSKLDQEGNFNLTFPSSAATYIFLMVDNAKGELVAEPGKTYEINFLAKDSDAVTTLSIPTPVELEFLNSGKTELNALMANFSDSYESFLEDHRGMIAKKETAVYGKIDTMRTNGLKIFSSYNNPYLTNFIEYTFASLEDNIALQGDEKIFKKYIEGKKIQPENYDYMHFFNQYYSKVASGMMSNPATQAEIEKQDFSSLMNYFKQNKFLANDTLCEMVVLKSLASSRIYKNIKINSVLAILEQAGRQCKTETDKRTALNLKKKLSVMNIGKPAPSLAFLDMNGKTVALSNFKGKYIYLNFWASWCTSCEQEMSLIPELKKMYGSKIAFVSISVDKNIDAMKNFVKKNPKLDWIFLYCDDYKKAKEEFNVLTVPTYYLIDPKGNVFRSPADRPQDIEPTFTRIKKKQQ
jgi:thiol-disulfide isomerase/thioredoxin